MSRAYLGLGSNLGDRAGHLAFGIRELARHGLLVARSPLVETEPVDCPRGGRFLNACVCLEPACSASALLAAALRIERARGRRRQRRNDPRVLDIDLLMVDDIVLARPGLRLPHPRMHQRAFVLEPLAAIAPLAVHPVLNRSVQDLRRRLPS